MNHTFPATYRPYSGLIDNIPDPDTVPEDRLELELLLDDGSKANNYLNNPNKNSANLIREDIQNGLHTHAQVLGYRWNDKLISPYIELQERLDFPISLDKLETIFETQKQIENQKSGKTPNFHKLFRQSTNRVINQPQLKRLLDWWENPEKNVIDNAWFPTCVLKMIDAPGGGQRVITPRGHTISKSDAYRIYCAMMGYYYYGNVSVMPLKVKAREYDRGEWLKPHYVPVSWDSHGRGSLRIGCQAISKHAIVDLGRREGWEKKK